MPALTVLGTTEGTVNMTKVAALVAPTYLQVEGRTTVRAERNVMRGAGKERQGGCGGCSLSREGVLPKTPGQCKAAARSCFPHSRGRGARVPWGQVLDL